MSSAGGAEPPQIRRFSRKRCTSTPAMAKEDAYEAPEAWMWERSCCQTVGTPVETWTSQWIIISSMAPGMTCRAYAEQI